MPFREVESAFLHNLGNLLTLTTQQLLVFALLAEMQAIEKTKCNTSGLVQLRLRDNIAIKLEQALRKV